MELRHLRYFIAVADNLHFTRAAIQLHMAQPPLSQQIHALEQELDAPLFHRLGRRIELTDAGTSFRDDARNILAEVERAALRARRARDGDIGRLSLGFTESASFSRIVTGTIHAYQINFPEVKLSLAQNQSAALGAMLISREIDVAFLRPPIEREDLLTFRLLRRERTIVALPSDHRLAGTDQVSLADLRQDAFVSYPRTTGPGLSDQVIAACAAQGFTPKLGQSAPRLSATINLVAAGFGVSIVPESLRQLQPDGVVYRALADGPEALLGLAYRTEERSARVLNLVGRFDAAV
jgi:DNA-binding transcriptional LysR family regulator